MSVRLIFHDIGQLHVMSLFGIAGVAKQLKVANVVLVAVEGEAVRPLHLAVVGRFCACEGIGGDDEVEGEGCGGAAMLAFIAKEGSQAGGLFARPDALSFCH